MRKDWEPEFHPEHGWQVEFSIEGRRIRRRLGIRDRGLKDIARRKAEALYRQEWEGALSPAPPPRKGTPFYKAAQGYVEAGGEARYLPPLIRYFGPDVMCEDIGPAEVAAAALALYPACSPDTHRPT